MRVDGISNDNVIRISIDNIEETSKHEFENERFSVVTQNECHIISVIKLNRQCRMFLVIRHCLLIFIGIRFHVSMMQLVSLTSHGRFHEGVRVGVFTRVGERCMDMTQEFVAGWGRYARGWSGGAEDRA